MALRRVIAEGILARETGRHMHVDVRARRKSWQRCAIDVDQFDRADVDRFKRLARNAYLEWGSSHANASDGCIGMLGVASKHGPAELAVSVGQQVGNPPSQKRPEPIDLKLYNAL